MSEEFWKKCFRDATTNIAFNLQVSKKQARLLAIVHEEEECAKKKWTIITPGFSSATYSALERKGLLTHDGDKYLLSEAGRLVMDLLLLIYDKQELYNTRVIIKGVLE